MLARATPGQLLNWAPRTQAIGGVLPQRRPRALRRPLRGLRHLRLGVVTGPPRCGRGAQPRRADKSRGQARGPGPTGVKKILKRQKDRLFFCDKNHDDGVDAVSARARSAVVRGAQERAQIDPGHLREGLHDLEGRRRHSPHDARRHLRRPETAQRVHLGRGVARRRLQARRRARREPRPAALPRGAAPAPFRARARPTRPRRPQARSSCRTCCATSTTATRTGACS